MDSLLRLALALFALCAPVRKEGRMIAAHHSLLRAGGATSRDYVQDGLYYHLDGIENAGQGIHSATASSWTDLTGNGRDATFINPSGKAWLDNAVYLYGKTSDGMAKIYGVPHVWNCTFEMCFRVDSYEMYGRLWDNEKYFNGTGQQRFNGLVTSGDNLFGTFSFWDGGDFADFTDFPTSSFSSAQTISLYPTQNAKAITTVVKNGTITQSCQSSFSRTPSIPTTNFIDVANRSNNANRGCDMAVFAIRVYSRVLTAAEIAHNYAIDKARFNLP